MVSGEAALSIFHPQQRGCPWPGHILRAVANWLLGFLLIVLTICAIYFVWPV
jgi:hypothetical protein